jgi:hypothetical protein
MTKTKSFGSLEIGIWILPFDLAQGGESFDFAQDREPVERLVEPFVICYLMIGIFLIQGYNFAYISRITFLIYLWGTS